MFSIKTAEVEGEIILLELLARISQRHIHYLHRPSSDTAVVGFLPNGINDIGAASSFTLPIRRFEQDSFDDVNQFPYIARPVMRLQRR